MPPGKKYVQPHEEAEEIETGYGAHADCFGFDHINRNAPVLIRTPKLKRFEPA